MIRKAGHGGGLILSSSNSIHSAVKPGNYLAMWNAIRMYGKYPIQLDPIEDCGAVRRSLESLGGAPPISVSAKRRSGARNRGPCT